MPRETKAKRTARLRREREARAKAKLEEEQRAVREMSYVRAVRRLDAARDLSYQDTKSAKHTNPHWFQVMYNLGAAELHLALLIEDEHNSVIYTDADEPAQLLESASEHARAAIERLPELDDRAIKREWSRAVSESTLGFLQRITPPMVMLLAVTALELEKAETSRRALLAAKPWSLPQIAGKSAVELYGYTNNQDKQTPRTRYNRACFAALATKYARDDDKDELFELALQELAYAVTAGSELAEWAWKDPSLRLARRGSRTSLFEQIVGRNPKPNAPQSN